MATIIKRSRSRRKKALQVREQNGAAEIRELRRVHGLSQSLLARVLDISVRTVSGLESGSVAPTKVRRNLTQLTRLCNALAEAMESSYVSRWLDEPNEMLAGLKPVEALERGQTDLVWQVVEGLRSGSQL
jgi:DNA-binding transcriptional regulator YiaG